MRWLVIALGIAGCSGSDTKDDTDTDTTETTETTDTTDTTPATGTIQFVYADFFTQAPVEGALVSAADQSATTDATGLATLDIAVDAGRFESLAEADGYPLHRWEDGPVADGMSQRSVRLLVSDATLATLAGALGVAIDPTKGLVIVQVNEATVDGAGFESGGPVVGTQVALSAASDVSLVEADSALGLAPGDTLAKADGVGFVVFVNVPPGEVTVDLTLPDAGTTCSVTYGVVSGTTFDDITVGAGEITNIVYYCP